jgi:hypothetical protein
MLIRQKVHVHVKFVWREYYFKIICSIKLIVLHFDSSQNDKVISTLVLDEFKSRFKCTNAEVIFN